MTNANVLLLVIDIGVFKDVIHLALLFVGIDLDSPGVARDVSFLLGATGLQVVDFSCETYVSIYAIIIIWSLLTAGDLARTLRLIGLFILLVIVTARGLAGCTTGAVCGITEGVVAAGVHLRVVGVVGIARGLARAARLADHDGYAMQWSCVAERGSLDVGELNFSNSPPHALAYISSDPSIIAYSPPDVSMGYIIEISNSSTGHGMGSHRSHLSIIE